MDSTQKYYEIYVKFMGSTVSGQNLRRNIRLWLVNQRRARWRRTGTTQRQARELISGPCPGAKTRFLSFNL